MSVTRVWRWVVTALCRDVRCGVSEGLARRTKNLARGFGGGDIEGGLVVGGAKGEGGGEERSGEGIGVGKG